MEGKQYWAPLTSSQDSFNPYFTKMGLSSGTFFDEYDLSELSEDCLFVLCSKVLDKSYYSSAVASSKFILTKQTDALCNACGVIAGLNVIANSKEVKLKEGSLLETVFENFKLFSDDEKPEWLANNIDFKQFHEAQLGKAEESDSNLEFHFSVLIADDGKIYEIDGRRSSVLEFESSSVAEEIIKRLDGNVIDYNFAIMSFKKDS